MATTKKSLNDIGPGVLILARNGTWSVRFRLPAELAAEYDLPRNPRRNPRASRAMKPSFTNCITYSYQSHTRPHRRQ